MAGTCQHWDDGIKHDAPGQGCRRGALPVQAATCPMHISQPSKTPQTIPTSIAADGLHAKAIADAMVQTVLIFRQKPKPDGAGETPCPAWPVPGRLVLQVPCLSMYRLPGSAKGLKALPCTARNGRRKRPSNEVAEWVKGLLHLAIVGSCHGLGVAEEIVSDVAVCSFGLNLSMSKRLRPWHGVPAPDACSANRGAGAPVLGALTHSVPGDQTHAPCLARHGAGFIHVVGPLPQTRLRDAFSRGNCIYLAALEKYSAGILGRSLAKSPVVG
jgi:hypothetical protein